MEDIAVLIFWVAIIAGGLANSVIKAKKKREEAERRARQFVDSDTGTNSGSGTDGKFGRKSLGEILEELARQPSPAVAPRPVSTPETADPFQSVAREPAATSEDYYSLETEGITEELYGSEDELAAYEKLAAERAYRTTYLSGTKEGRSTVGARVSSVAPPPVTEDTQTTTLQEEILGGEFDLRRAVIEAEILTPKFERY